MTSGGSTSLLRRLAILMALLVCVFSIALLTSEVRRELRALAETDTDMTQWALTQLEVEIMAFQATLHEAEMAYDRGTEPDLARLRQRFDIAYSRIATLTVAPKVNLLRVTPDFDYSMVEIAAFLEKATPIIDGPDEALLASTQELSQLARDTHRAARSLALDGIVAASTLSDARRAQLSDTLLRLAIVLLVVLVALMGLMVWQLRLRIAARREADRHLATRSRLEAVIGTSIDAILVCDKKGRIVDVNGAAEGVFARPRDSFIGIPLSDLLAPEESGLGARLVGGNAEGPDGAAHQFRTSAQRANGEAFTAEVSVSPVRHSGDDIQVLFLRDISHRAQAEADLRAARDKAVASEKAKTDMLAVMSHEMRTPLNGLLASLDIMAGSTAEQDQRRYIEVMKSSGEVLLSHVNDVLDITRLEAGELPLRPEPFDLRALIQEIADSQQSLASAGGTELFVDLDFAPAGLVVGDADRLRQIVYNLLGNALKFAPKGSVSIEVEQLPRGDTVEVRVIDTGVGIAPDQLRRIFDDFVTLDASYARSASGTGLGLGIARRLAERMGGAIGAESEEGEGALFWLRLPLPASQLDGSGNAAKEEGTPATRPLNILIVEDNEANRLVARAMLEQDGHRVTEAESGAAGIELAENEAFDLIAMDVSMPGMDGVTATRFIRQGSGQSAWAPILAVTAHALPRDLGEFRRAGMSGILIKPVLWNMWREAIAKVTGPGGTDIWELDDSPVANSLPVLDDEVFGALRSTLPEGQIDRLTAAFVEETDLAVTGLSEGDDWPPDTPAQLHKLAGSAALCGASRFRGGLVALQQQVEAGEAPSPDLAMASIMVHWDETKAVLKAAATLELHRAAE